MDGLARGRGHEVDRLVPPSDLAGSLARVSVIVTGCWSP